MKIIDCHAHLVAQALFSPKGPTEAAVRATAEDLIGVMNKWGITAAAVSHTAALRSYNWENGKCYGNDVVAKAVLDFPSRIIGTYAPNLSLGTEEQVRKDILDNVDRHNFRCLKLHPILGGFPANAVELKPIYEAAREASIPILYHSGHIPYCTPAEMFDMAKRFPGVNIIVGHAGKTELCHDVLALARYVPNLYIDTCSQPNRLFLERFIQEIGSERVLFASDWVGVDAKGALPMRVLEIEELDISNSEQENVFFYNAIRLFRLEEGDPT